MPDTHQPADIPDTRVTSAADTPLSTRADNHNRAARLLPADEPGTLPAMDLAGVLLFGYLQADGDHLRVRVTVDLETTAADLCRRGVVPLTIAIGDTVVYDSTDTDVVDRVSGPRQAAPVVISEAVGHAFWLTGTTLMCAPLLDSGLIDWACGGEADRDRCDRELRAGHERIQHLLHAAGAHTTAAAAPRCRTSPTPER